MAFSDAYPSTIDQGTFPLVKHLYRARYCKYVSGLLYCADDGSKLGTALLTTTSGNKVIRVKTGLNIHVLNFRILNRFSNNLS